MKMKLFSIIKFICLLIHNCAFISTTEIIPERAEIVNSTYIEGRYNFSRCRITRFNRTTYVFETEFDLMVDLNNDYGFKLSYHYNRLSNNQYTRMPFELPKMTLCTFLEKYYRSYMMEYAKTISNFPQLKSGESICPFKKVNFYTLIFCKY